MATPDISIIIPVYNVEDYITQCLQSVMAQEPLPGASVENSPTMECIIVDDCGPDHSIDIAQQLVDAYTGPISFHILRRPANGGLSAARNTGIQHARGNYLYFLDSDDYLSPAAMATLWQQVIQHPGVTLVYGQTICTPNPKFLANYFNIHRSLNTHSNFYYTNNRQEIHSTHFHMPEIACNKLINTAWLRQHALTFREGIINEDNEWHLRAFQHIRDIATAVAEPLYFYVQRNNSITSERDQRAKLLRICEMYANAIPNIDITNPHILGHIYTVALDMRFGQSHLGRDIARQSYRHITSAIRHAAANSLRVRLVYYYSILPRPIFRVAILNRLISHLCPSAQ